jgi:hypothetical protein
MVSCDDYIQMKLVLDVPPDWHVARLADGRLRYIVPGFTQAAPDLFLLVREELPLPLDTGSWADTAFSYQLEPGRKLQIVSNIELQTHHGWPASLVSSQVLDASGQQVAGRIGALYRFLHFGAEAIWISYDRARFMSLRQQLLDLLATGRPDWKSSEVPSLHHLISPD